MTKLLEEKELAYLRDLYPWGEPSVPDGVLTHEGQVIRKLLSHVDALENTVAEVGQMYRDQFKDRLRAEKERDELKTHLADAVHRVRWLKQFVTETPPEEEELKRWNAALSSQEQKCETCGGTKIVHGFGGANKAACPDCSPSATEK